MSILLTIMAVFIPLAALLRGLRHGLYGGHVLVVVGASLLLFYSDMGAIKAFSRALLLPLLVIHLVSINGFTYLAYYLDKRASLRGRWRVPERTLHHFALIGGLPAAFLAQRVLRHKTRKQSFKTMFWVIAVVQVAVIFCCIIISVQ